MFFSEKKLFHKNENQGKKRYIKEQPYWCEWVKKKAAEQKASADITLKILRKIFIFTTCGFEGLKSSEHKKTQSKGVSASHIRHCALH